MTGPTKTEQARVEKHWRGKPWVEKPATLAKLKLDAPVVVDASAGTGKTYLLQHLVADLVVSRGADISEILVVTFTEKAAAELRARVRDTLRTIAHRPHSGPAPEHAWIVDEEVRGRARDALRRFDSAVIGTIHGFCLETMRELGVLAGLPPLHASEVIPEPFDDAWRSVLRRRVCDAVFSSYWALLPSKERGAIEVGSSILTGTRAPPSPSLDDMKRAAEAIVDAYRELGDPRMPSVDDHPFHRTVGKPWTKKRAKKLGAYCTWSQAILEGMCAFTREPRPWMELMLHVIAPAAGDLGAAGEVPYEALDYDGAFIAEPQRDFMRAALELSERARAVAIAVLGEHTATTMRRFHDEQGTLTYNEMIWRLRDALEGEQTRHGGAGPLVQALRARYRWGLIDEFQDTDEAQWDIFRTIFLRGSREMANGMAGESQAAAAGLVLVGDPKQAIYRFRGADFFAYQSAVEAATKTFGGSRLALAENFRSTSALLGAIHDVQAHELFPATDEIELKEVAPRADCSLDDEESERPLMLLRLPEVEDDDGRVAEYSKPEVDLAFADGIAAEIGRLLSNGCGARIAVDKVAGHKVAGHKVEGGSELEKPRPITARDICVLARRHADLDLVGRALRRAGVPFMHYKKRGLYKTAEALDLLDVLLAVQDPSKFGNVARALATVFFPVAPTHIDRYLGMTDRHVVRQTLETWSALGRRGDIPRLLRGLERDTGMMRRLLFHEGERSATNMQQLLEQLLELHAETGWGLDRIVEEVRRRTHDEVDELSEADLLRLESERELVRLMTMHTAKGLEFPIVFLMGGYRGVQHAAPRDPVVVHHEGRSLLALNPGEHTEQWRREEAQEEARLLYVAMTRAKAKLYLPWWDRDQVRAGFRAGMYSRVKRHLDDLVEVGGSDLVGFKDATRSPRAQLRIPGELDAEERKAIEAYRPSTAAPKGSAIDYRGITWHRRGPLLSSFTRLSEEVAAQPREPRPEAISDDAGREERIPDETGVDEAEVTPLDWTHEPDVRIPGGTLAGSAFHDVIERLLVDQASVTALRSAESFEAWHEQATETVSSAFRQLGFTVPQQNASARLIYETLRRPLGPALTGVSFCELADRLPELDFRMAIPETSHRLLADAFSGEGSGATTGDDDSPFSVRTGFLTGSLDLVFRHKGRSYVVDWKTNVIKSESNPERYDYSPEAVRALTEEKYGLQIEIYTLAMVRWLGLTDRESYERSFGGALYVYLRGFGRPGAAPGEGLYFHRPSFDEVAQWERRLATGIDYQRAKERAPHDQAAWRAA